MRQGRSPLLLGLCAAVLVLLWQVTMVVRAYEGNWTGLFCIGAKWQLPPDLERSSYPCEGREGYDAQFYRIVAHDPTMSRGYASYIDDARLRYRRILVPALARVLSFGADHLVDVAYVAVVVGALAAGVYWAAHLAPGYWSLGLLILPGALTSMDRMVLDGVLTALALGFWCYLRHERWIGLWIVCAAAPLVRETGLLLPMGATFHFVVGRDWRRTALFAVCAIPALLWFGFVHTRTPPSSAAMIVTDPVIGVIKRLLNVRSPLLVGITDTLSLLGMLLGAAIALVWVARREVPAGLLPLFAGFAALAFLLGSQGHLAEPYGFVRPVAPLMGLLFVEGVRSRHWTAVAAPVLSATGVALPIAYATGRAFL